MATVNLGRIRQVWRGTWATGTAYVKDDVVQEGVNSYICVTAHTAGATFAGDSANWNLMAQGAEIPSQSGQAGKALVTDGTSLSWGNGGSLVPLATHRVSGNTTNVYFPNVFTNDYDVYYMTCTKLVTATNSGQMFMRFTKNGDNTLHTDGDYRGISGGLEGQGSGQNDNQARNAWNQSEFHIHPAGGNTSNNDGTGGVNYQFYFHRPNANEWSNVQGTYVSTRDLLDGVYAGTFGGQCTTSTSMTGLQFFCSGGFNEGIFHLYGIAGA